MIVNFNFNLEAWVRSLRIEANSVEEAKEKLFQMTLEEMVNEGDGFYADSEMELTDIESKIIEYDATVKVSNIEYAFDEDEYDPAVIDYLKVRLPKELAMELTCVDDNVDIEDYIRDEIFSITNYDASTFDFEVVALK